MSGLPDPSDASFPFCQPSTFFANVIECIGFAGDHFENLWSEPPSAISTSSSDIAQLKALVESLQDELNKVKGRVRVRGPDSCHYCWRTGIPRSGGCHKLSSAN